MAGENSHEGYTECSLGVFKRNLYESRLKRVPAVKKAII